MKRSTARPPTAADKDLILVASDTRIRILDGKNVIATHRRSYARGEPVEDPEHRKALLKLRRKAQSSSAMQQLAAQLPEAELFVQNAFEKGESPRGLVKKLLLLLDDYGKHELRPAIQIALERQTPRLSSLAWLLKKRRAASKQKRPLPLTLDHRPELTELVIHPCGDDPTLRKEVESLVALKSDSFLEQPPLPVLKRELEAARLPLENGEPAMVGRTISHYKVVDRLGGGGMGVVFKAQDLKLDRFVALKFLPAQLTAEDDPSSRLVRERFTQEAKAASALDHPNIGTVYEIDETDDGQIFIAMACYEGETLAKKIGRGPLPIAEAVDLGRQMAEGLAEAHSKGIVHRDIKPANVMVTEGGRVKIIDFGLARLADATRITAPGTIVGTVGYMAPEQIRTEAIDERADVWALGVVLYEMLTGQLPFRGENPAAIVHSIVTDQPTPVETLREGIPPELGRIVSKALQKRLTSRYKSASEVREHFTSVRSEGSPLPATVETLAWRRHLRKPAVAVSAALTLLLLFGSLGWFFHRSARRNWARRVAIPEIRTLVDDQKYTAAFVLAREAEKYIPRDTTLTELWRRVSLKVSFETTPPGADISIKEYGSSEAEWEYLGPSPIHAERVPVGATQWRAVKAGFITAHRAIPLFRPVEAISVALQQEGSVPVDMVRIPGGFALPWIFGINALDAVPLQDFLMDKYEVTNRQFKAFVESGGYKKKQYWKHPFTQDGRVLSWEEAMRQLRDATGRPGPATWKLGSYPEGEEVYPVSGVSWYEAAAYAEFAGKSLPTIYHWLHASGTRGRAYITPVSNFASDGAAPVGSHPGMAPYGTYDAAGNVREWCWNQSGELRHVLGGAWNDPSYMFSHVQVRSPFDRSPGNGFRCVRYLGAGDVPVKSTGPVELSARDYLEEVPVSDDVFQIYKAQFSYDRTDLNADVESVDEASEYWTLERVTFNAAYGNERMVAYVFKPKTVPPPYQAVLYFWAIPAIFYSSFEEFEGLLGLDYVDFIAKSGRALVLPIYKGTLERNDGLESVWPNTTHRYADYLIKWGKDFKRTIDYLETRDDIDTDRLAFFGISWGGWMGAIIPAIEERLKVSLLYSGGLVSGRALPEVDQINYVTRVTVPTLMLSGRHDSMLTVESAQIPMFQLLGTPAEHKRHVLYDTGHLMPLTHIIRESLDWLDRYLGPVQ